jgi:PAS domain S-box-containing protein
LYILVGENIRKGVDMKGKSRSEAQGDSPRRGEAPAKNGRNGEPSFHVSPAGFYRCSPEGRYLIVSPRFARMLGYDSPDEMAGAITDIGRQVYLRAGERAESLRIADLEEACSAEIQLVTREGEPLWVSDAIQAVRGKNRMVIYYDGLVHDISARKAAEAALREREGLYRTLVDLASDMVFVKDDRLQNIFVNKKLIAFSGKTEKDLIGKTDSAFMATASAKIARVTDVKATMSLSVTTSEQTIGDRIYETRKFPVRLGDGVTGVGGFIRDITEYKRAEQALKAKSSSIEEVNVALRVLLRQREEDRNEVKEKVFCNVKNLVLPYVDALKRRRLPEEERIYVEILETNLKNVISPFVQKMLRVFSDFTPTEILVANFIKEGKTIKEVAAILRVSEDAVNRHRQHIRNKLGLNKKKVNLKIYLMSLK